MGHINDPLEFPPRRFCSWTHRFDDPSPRRIYRTLYCAYSRETCFREIFDPLYPNLKAAKDLSTTLGCSLEEALAEGGRVPLEQIFTSAIAPARIEILSGDLADLRDVDLRRQLEIEHADLLLAHKLTRLDTSVTRGPERIVTQTIGRSLYERGAAGAIYGSKVDDLHCIALFEGRARLVPDGQVEPLAALLGELAPIFRELHLTLVP